MKAVSLFGIGIILSVLAMPVAIGGDVEDVKEAYLRHITLSRTGQVDEFLKQHLPGHTAFGPDGGLLIRFDSLEDERNFRQAAAEGNRAGNDAASSNVGSVARQVRHLEVEIFGTTALVTGYVRGPVTLPDGTRQQGTRRLTSVWVKQGNQWTEVHDHMSALVTTQAP